MDLKHFHKTGVAKMVEYGSRLIEDKEKLSTRFIDIADMISEASYWAARNGNDYVMAEDVPVWADHVFPLPDHVSSADATFLDALGVVVHAVEKSGITAGESALVMGTGVLGLLAIQTLKSYGAADVICADLSDLRLEKGSRLGADRMVNVKSQSLTDTVLQATDGVGVRAIIDTVGRPLMETLPILARGGRLVNLAVHDQEEKFNQLWTAGERTIMTSANFEDEDYPLAMELLYSGRVRVEPLITHRFPLDRALEAFAATDDKEKTGAIKVIINPT